jgi:signal transduction histidine kinase/ligand-binding sensor domain-containing protein
MRIVLCFVVMVLNHCLLFVEHTYGQMPRDAVKFERLGLDEGLSQSSIYAIAQDRTGFLWLATQDGVNRYDGYTFRTFRNIPDDSLSLALNWINDIYTAPSGRIWVITRSAVNLFNPIKETFTPFYCIPANAKAHQTSITISCCLEDASGTLWVGTSGGLAKVKIDESNFTRGNVEFLSASDAARHGFSGMSVSSLQQDSASRLWIGTPQGLFVRERGAERFMAVPLPGGAHSVQSVSALCVVKTVLWAATNDGLVRCELSSSPHLDNNSVQYFHPEKALPASLRTHNDALVIKPDSHGNLWLQMAAGLLLFDPQTASVQAFLNDPKDAASLRSNIISALAEDMNGRMWIATFGGLNIYNSPQKTLTAYQHSPSDPKSLGHNLLRSLYQDRNGSMWVGTDNGINSWNSARYKFTSYKSEPTPTSIGGSLSNSSVRGFLPDKRHRVWNGNLWICTDNGLNYFDPRTQRWKNFAVRDGLTNAEIRAQAQTPDGTLWLGTNGGGLVRFDGKRFTQIAYNPDDSTSLASNRVRWLVVDNEGGIWAGLFLTQGVRGITGGLSYHPSPSLSDAQTGWKRFQTNPNDTSSLINNEVRCIYIDPADTSGNTFWVGTQGAGLEKFDRRQGTFTHFKSDAKNNSTLSSNIITSIFRTSKDELWVTTAAGLNLFHPATQTFTRFTVKDGLPNDFVYGCLEDGNGNLWMSSNNGLSRFDPRTKTFQNYDRTDGLPGNEFNSGAFAKLPSGEMLFGGLEGFTMFRPDSITNDTKPPVVAITWFNVLNKPRTFDKPLNELDEIRLEYNENFIAFEFAALEFVNSSQNHYAYKLEGLDGDWIFPKGRRYAAYTDLEPGEYTFRVKASNSDGIWNETGKSIRIVILPPFWATWWFRASSLLALCVGLWLTHKTRLRVVQHRNRLLQKLVQERTADLEQSNAEITAADEEIRRQNAVLEEQTRHIELANGELQERNVELQVVNEQLEEYSAEMNRFSEMLEEQAREVELVNTELQEKNEALQALNQRKNEIIGVVAHDLKNPLTAIMMTASMVSRYWHKMKQEEVLQNIRRIEETGDRMHKIILDLLDVEAIETGTFNLTPETVDIATILRATVGDYAEAAQEKGITIHHSQNNIQPAGTVLITADKRALRQVLDNLISNAVKYSFPQSNVWLDIVLSDCNVLVSIRDEGPGLSAEDQALLFGRFAKLTPRPTAGEHSTGLGLSIVKQLVELMHGTISCQSEQGKGTTFTVSLPRVATPI